MAKTHTYTNDHEWYQSGLNVRAGDKLICTATDHYADSATLYEEKLANARLMAAAPELLSTLLHLLPNLQKHDLDDDVRDVMQAIGLAVDYRKVSWTDLMGNAAKKKTDNNAATLGK